VVPALSFQKRFVAGVENGVAQAAGKPLPHPGVLPKRGTIRAKRKRPFKVDDDLMLYYGMRTKQCRKLGDAVCECARRIWIDKDFVEVEGIELDVAQVRALALQDGFKSERDMMQWFEETHGFSFFGQLIEW